MKEKKTRAVMVRLTEKEYKDLAIVCIDIEKSIQSIIRDLIQEWLKKYKIKIEVKKKEK